MAAVKARFATTARHLIGLTHSCLFPIPVEPLLAEFKGEIFRSGAGAVMRFKRFEEERGVVLVER
jgi:hypothetical protein